MLITLSSMVFSIDTFIADEIRIRKDDLMSSATRVETNRTSCECGNGEFVFYACEVDQWSYRESLHERWFEMHIFCEPCAGLFQQNKIAILSDGEEKPHWRIVIPEPGQVPPH